MRRLSILCLLLPLILINISVVRAQQPSSEQVKVLSPLPGQALQGSVPVSANITVPSIVSIELSFAYYKDPTNTWFLIAEVSGSAGEQYLADWDTSTMTDGNYDLRVVVTRGDGRHFTTVVPGVRVRNYTPIETPTPTPSPTLALGETPQPTSTPLPTPTQIPATATPLPTNPAQIMPGELSSAMGRGALGALAGFALIAIYGSARRYIRR